MKAVNRSLLHGTIALIITLGMSLIIALQINACLGLSMRDKALPADIHMDTQADPAGSVQALPLRIADFGSVGVIPDTENWGNDYSHNLRHLENALLPNPPYVDPVYFERAEKEFRAYVDLLAASGINGLIVPFMLEFINFDRVGNGYDLYGQNDPFRYRHQTFKRRFKHLFEYARQKGIDIFLYSDMVMLTPRLESYLINKVGRLDTSHPEFWQVYQKGLEELFIAFPEVKGIYIRIGEAGTIYNVKGWDYRSELLVRTGQAVRNMLKASLDVAERFDKLVVFRTWSVGPLYRKALLSFLEKNRPLEGIWLWTQYGGPLQAGPLSFYPFHGFNLITDLNVYITARLALHPDLDMRQSTARWVRSRFGKDPVMVPTLGDVLMSTFEISFPGSA